MRLRAIKPDVRIDISGADHEKIERDVCSEISDTDISSLGGMAGYACTKAFSDPFGVIWRRDQLLARDLNCLTWSDLVELLLEHLIEHGPNVFRGYWRMPGKTVEELRENEFFITGDLGQISKGDCLSIVHLEKDLIITGGYNV